MAPEAAGDDEAASKAASQTVVEVTVAGGTFSGDVAASLGGGSRVVAALVTRGSAPAGGQQPRRTALVSGAAPSWGDTFAFTGVDPAFCSVALSVVGADDKPRGEAVLPLDEVARMGDCFDAIGQEGARGVPALSLAPGIALRVRVALRQARDGRGPALARTSDPGPMRLDEAVNRALREVLAAQDPFSAADFDPVQHLNGRFRNAAALREVDEYARQLSVDVARKDAELRERVRHQAEQARHAEESLSSAKRSIEQLFSKVQEIRRMSEQSEAMVKDICTEISWLDNAKNNLEKATDALGALLELNRSIQELDHETAAPSPNLDVCANHLTRCSKELQRLHGHEKALVVVVLAQRLESQKERLLRATKGEFRDDLFDDQVQHPTLESATRIVDVIGGNSREDACKDIIGTQMRLYSRAFPRGSDDARMERMEKRFVWLRRRLKYYDDELAGAIPRSWGIPVSLCTEFCDATRTSMASLLEEQSRQGQKLNVEILVRVMQKTMEFEKELAKRVQKYTARGGVSPAAGSSGAAAAAARYKRVRHEDPEGAPAGDDENPPKFSICSAFESCMEHYVQHEDNQMGKFLEELSIVEEVPASDGVVAAFPNTIDVFFYIKDSLMRCSSFCNAETLVSMFNVWVKHLCAYAQRLEAHIPTHSYEGALRLVCLIVNTADYCQETAGKVAEELRAKVEPLPLEQDEKAPDEFRLVISKGVQQMISNLTQALTPPLEEMVSMNWDTLEDVGDQSKYVTDICHILHERFTTINNELQPSLLRYVCDKFVANFMPRYISTIYRLKRLNGPACQQLLLDLQVLKSLLPDLPNLGNPDRFTHKELRAYHRVIRRDVGRGEGILKFLSADIPANDVVLAEHYWQLSKPRVLDGQEQPAVIEDPSLQDFRRLLELKGIPERERRMLEDHLRQISGGIAAESQADSTFRGGAAAAAHDARPGRDLAKHFGGLKRGGDKFWDKLKQKQKAGGGQ
eukprot:TRINITY_DN3407_c0_g2_i1.p1 TRINITY_DN3407_c0_g2~~TRINITY_DN3407_c0_g2_i1.p1  ORF type:complete len:977 (+),score=327.09 TRINITY_DN3407_c0_g2_i1:96-3026(+)